MDVAALFPTAVAAVLVGAVLLGLLVLGLGWLRARRPAPASFLPPVALPEAAQGEASGVLVAEPGGRLVFVNDRARRYLGLNGQAPNLGNLLRQTKPNEALLELLAQEGRASLRIGERQLEAASLRLPAPRGGEQMVVVLREPEARPEPPAAAGQRADELAVISLAVAASLDPAETYAAILGQLPSLVRLDLAELNLWDPAARALRPVGHAGDRNYPQELARAGGAYAAGEGYSGWLAANRTPLLVERISAFAAARPKLYDADFPFQSYLGVPLLAGDHLVGTLEVASYEAGAYGPEDQRRLTWLAEQAAQAMRNAERHAQQQRRVAELSGLAEITRALQAASDPRELYGRLTSEVARFLDVQIVAFMTYDEARRALVGQPPFHGMPDIVAEVIRIPLPAGSQAETLWLTAEHWRSGDVPGDPMIDALGLRQFAETTGLRTILMAPVAAAGRRRSSPRGP